MLNRAGGNSVRRMRAFGAASAPFFVLTAVVFVVPVLSGGAASAGVSAPVPVAGVPAFGIGASQIGNSYSANPFGIAFDSKGDLFVANEAGNSVLEYTSSSPTSYSQVGATVAGAGGEGSGLNQLYYPTAVALDAKGDLFVSDSLNDRVVEYAYNTSTGSYAASGTVVAGTGKAGAGLNQLSDPQGITVDAKGDLFVADNGNNRVEEFAYNSSTGTYASSATDVAGTGVFGTANNELEYPTSVALNAAGNLFVGDYANARVMEYTYSSSTGTFSSSGTEVVGLPSQAGWLAFDSSGDLFASYGYLGYGGVVEYAYNSVTGTYASTGTQIASGDMIGPEGVAFNASGDLFVAETAETSDPSQTVWDSVLEFTYNSSAATWNPLGTIMGQIGRTNGGISAVALDSNGNLFVSDGVSNGNNPAGVFEFPFNSSSGARSVVGSLITSASGSALAFDSNNDLFVAESSGVVEFPYSSGGYPASASAVPGATQLATLTGVTGLAFDGNNNLFVSDGNQVLKFGYNSSSGTWAASGTVVVTITPGTLPSGYFSWFTGISGIALDANGDLFVSNPTASAVQEFLYNAGSGTYATTGITVAGAGGAGTGLNQLYEPSAVGVDHSGDLFVYDASNARIMEFTGNPATGSYGANGTEIYNVGGTNYPQNGGLALDAQGDLFFGSDDNSAVVYEAAASGSTPPTTTTRPHDHHGRPHDDHHGRPHHDHHGRPDHDHHGRPDHDHHGRPDHDHHGRPDHDHHGRPDHDHHDQPTGEPSGKPGPGPGLRDLGRAG